MNPGARSIFEKHINKVHWCILSFNPSAINMLEKNFLEGGNKVNWTYLSENPEIFVPYRDPVLFDILMEIEIK
jgi:hypothetical protein